MGTHRRLKIASRISALLETELGEGIDPPRMVVEPLYARDVLLVCEAMPGTALATLAAEFRTDTALPAGRRGATRPASAAAQETPAFSASRFLNSIFGGLASDTPGEGALPRLRGWLGRSGRSADNK